MSAARTSATVEAQVIDGYHAKVRVRQFEAEVDEPPVVGGTDMGPMPTEYLLMGLASCFALAVAHVARRDGVEVGPVRVSVVATYDGPSFSSVTVTVHLEETSGSTPMPYSRRPAASATYRTPWPAGPRSSLRPRAGVTTWVTVLRRSRC